MKPGLSFSLAGGEMVIGYHSNGSQVFAPCKSNKGYGNKEPQMTQTALA